MSERGTRTSSWHYWPGVLLATFSVVVLPVAAVYAIEIWSGISFPILFVVMGIGLSLGTSSLGSWLWARTPRSRDLVFGDLMVWGWVQRLRVESRLTRTTELLLGLESADSPVSTSERTKILERLASDLESRDPYTHGHSRRVARHAFMIAKSMGLPNAQMAKIRTAAAVHDVGKLDIPLEVLNKPGRLTDEEFDQVKTHASRGAELVSGLGDSEMTLIVRHHHERLDGRGYPDRLSGEEIPVGARVIAVADTFDALTSTRAYRSASKHKKALEILKKESGAQLDPDVVAAFLTYYSGRDSFSWWVSLTTGPQRLIAWIVSLLRSPALSGVLQGTAAVGAAVIVGGAAIAPATSVASPVSQGVSSQVSEQSPTSGSLLVDSNISTDAQESSGNGNDVESKDSAGRDGPAAESGGGDSDVESPSTDDAPGGDESGGSNHPSGGGGSETPPPPPAPGPAPEPPATPEPTPEPSPEPTPSPPPDEPDCIINILGICL